MHNLKCSLDRCDGNILGFEICTKSGDDRFHARLISETYRIYSIGYTERQRIMKVFVSKSFEHFDFWYNLVEEFFN